MENDDVADIDIQPEDEKEIKPISVLSSHEVSVEYIKDYLTRLKAMPDKNRTNDNVMANTVLYLPKTEEFEALKSDLLCLWVIDSFLSGNSISSVAFASGIAMGIHIGIQSEQDKAAK